MGIELWFQFSLATMVLLLIPGPTILTVISYSISHGYKAKIPLILAVALADTTSLALSLLGLGALLAESAYWFQVVKWIGGLYLIFLGIRLFSSAIKPTKITMNEKISPAWRLFVDTYLVTVLNPKGIIFFVAFLPQFINTKAQAAPQLWILAITFVTLSTLNTTMYAVFASKARQLISSPKTQGIFNICGGTLLASAGIWALSARQP